MSHLEAVDLPHMNFHVTFGTKSLSTVRTEIFLATVFCPYVVHFINLGCKTTLAVLTPPQTLPPNLFFSAHGLDALL